jgi:hypothetical protein
VNVESEGRIEPLNDGHGAGLERTDDSDPAGAPVQPRRHRTYEQTQREAGQRRVEGHLVAKTVGDGQNPLSARDSRQDLSNEVSSGVGHPPADARRAETTALTRERHETAVSAVFAAGAEKAIRQDAAFEKGLDFGDDEARERSFVAARFQIRQESSPVFLERFVEQHLFGAVPLERTRLDLPVRRIRWVRAAPESALPPRQHGSP